jgi:MarR family transcriptional regulator, organic hydroperoxide resistance regulator
MPMADKIFLYHQLQLAAAVLRTQADRMGMAAAGVSAAQAGALLVIAAKPGATQRAVAQALGQGESAFNTMATRLVAAGLVQRADDPQDPRAWALHITPKGQDALGKIQEGLLAINQRISQVLSAQEQARMAQALSHLAAIDMAI